MGRICIKIDDICVLEVLTRGRKAYAAYIKPSVAKCMNEEYELVEPFEKFIKGELGPEDILGLIEFGKGVKKLVQIAALAIPRGKVAFYEQIARLTGLHPKVVGALLASNELPIVIPCHRVVRKNGDLGGYTAGVELKRALLKFEGVTFKGVKIAKCSFVDDLELKSRYHLLLKLIVNHRM